MFPDVDTREHRFWMGLPPSPPDSLLILGEVQRQKGLYLALGHGHFGMTGGPSSGKIVHSDVCSPVPEADH